MGYTWVSSFSSGSSDGSLAYHSVLIGTDREMRKAVAIRGGPRSGRLVAEVDTFDENFKDTPADIIETKEVGSWSGSLNEFKAKLTDFVNNVNEAEITYAPLGPNSNTATSEAAKQLGFDPPDPPEGIWTPGYRGELAGRGKTHGLESW